MKILHWRTSFPINYVIYIGILLVNFQTQDTISAPVNGGEHVWDATTYYSTNEFLTMDGILFQKFRDCYRAHSLAFQEVLVEEPDDLSRPGTYEAGFSFEVWSPFIEEFNFYNELQLDDDPAVSKYHAELYADPHYDGARYAILIWITDVVTVYLLHTFYYFIMGIILGTPLIWVIPRVYPHLHDYGRRLIVGWMVTWRERIRYNDKEAYNEIYRDVFYRVPYFFREHTSESEPEPIRNLLDPFKRWEAPYDDVFILADLNYHDLKNLTQSQLASLYQIDEGLLQRHVLTTEEMEDVAVNYINEIRERDPLRTKKDYEKMYQDIELEEQLTRLKADLTDIGFNEPRKNRRKPRPRPKPHIPDTESSELEVDRDRRRGLPEADSLIRLREKKPERHYSIPAVPHKNRWKEEKKKNVHGKKHKRKHRRE